MIDEKIKKFTKESFEKIGKSDVFVVLFNEKMVDQVIPLIQMGLAVYLDKPIKLLVPKGIQIPANLRTMSVGLAYYDPDGENSLEEATKKLALDQ